MITIKCAVANEQFGVSRGVCLQTVQWKFGSSPPVAALVNPRPNAKPQDEQNIKYMKPTFRCGTRKAIDELAEELNLPNDLTMQDWEYTAGNPHEIEKYISHYVSTTDDDKKFVLMELIIQATEDQETEDLFITYWNKIKPILEKDFKIHEYTIYYWSCFDNEDVNNCWKLTPLIRQFWLDNKVKYKQF